MNLDGTEEGRAMAAATRQAAKRKVEEQPRDAEALPSAKKAKVAQQRRPTATHTVAVPDGYTPAAQLDPSVHGALANLKIYPVLGRCLCISASL